MRAISKSHGRSLGLGALVAGAALGWSRCSGPLDDDGSDPSGGQPEVPGAVLEFEGISIARDQVEQFYPYLERLDPRIGRKTRIRGILTEHVLQVAIARRDHPELRAIAREAAQAFADNAGNYLELVELGQAQGIGSESELPNTRTSLPLAVAQFAFAEENLGAVSPPIECPAGFVVIASNDILRGVSTIADLCQAFIVWFPTHSTHDDFSTWWRDARDQARGTVTYVHPEYQDALPRWLHP